MLACVVQLQLWLGFPLWRMAVKLGVRFIVPAKRPR